MKSLGRRYALQTLRSVLGSGAAAALGVGAPLVSQGATLSGPVWLQLIDQAPSDTDVCKDYAVGTRLAFMEHNARQRSGGRRLSLETVEIDTRSTEIQPVLARIRDRSDALGMVGTVGGTLALNVTRQLIKSGLEIPHVAPWLQDTGIELGESTAAIFAGRTEQLAHVLRSLSHLGISDLLAVVGPHTRRAETTFELGRMGRELGLRFRVQEDRQDEPSVARATAPDAPPIILYLGGTPELAHFAERLARQQRQRFLVAMADVNVHVLGQLSGRRSHPVIAAQTVPVVHSAVPIARSFREGLARYFDEAPTALGLSGYVAGRYALELSLTGTAPTRSSVLAAVRRRSPTDLGGFRVQFDAKGYSTNFVTQTLLTSEGKLVG